MAYWDKISSRGNVDDRRSAGPLALGGLGGAGVVVFIILNLLGGGDVSSGNLNDILNQLQQTQSASQQTGDAKQFEGADSYETFASTVLGSNDELWKGIFQQSGKTYTPPQLVLFRGATRSGCGTATSQVGPHYCPTDQTIYLDETFFAELQRRFGAEGGDVAEAYVIAHEVGHHVQNELGIMEKAQGDNEQSINLELQADCFAGVWAYSVAQLGVFQPGEIEEAIDAAAAVGDDRIQESINGRVNPETWTHGSSEQRVEWFKNGFESGKPASCNTFAG